MSEAPRVEVIAQPGAAPDAALSRSRELAERLMSGRGAHHVKLSRRWGVEVVCTPEFGRTWSELAARPNLRGFFLEVLT